MVVPACWRRNKSMDRMTAGVGSTARWQWGAGYFGRCRKIRMTGSRCRAVTAGSLVADVRLDNREELAAALGLAPSEARQLCDADLLLGCLERWSETALDRLVGDFAFALWDAPAQKLLLARDFLGQRPLHFHRGRGFFAFASMPKGLHALPEIPHAPDEQMVAEFLTLMPQRGSRSFFKDIERVEPAHFVTVTRDGVASRRYWQPQRPRPGQRQPDDYVEGLRHHLDQATQSRLRGADGVIGANLSAGLDSGAVTATAARLLAPSGGKVVAFTAVPREGYSGPRFKKSLWQRRTARRRDRRAVPQHRTRIDPLGSSVSARRNRPQLLSVRSPGAQPLQQRLDFGHQSGRA